MIRNAILWNGWEIIEMSFTDCRDEIFIHMKDKENGDEYKGIITGVME
tara:strand:+ start:1307 stop:1450 length:144 start_codon:yes stop_codon:yes gene_type:complete